MRCSFADFILSFCFQISKFRWHTAHKVGRHSPSRIRVTVGRLVPLQHRHKEMETGSFENQEQRKPLTETQLQQTACNHSNRRKIDTFPTSTERSDGKGRVYHFPLYVYNFGPLEDPFVMQSIQWMVINI